MGKRHTAANTTRVIFMKLTHKEHKETGEVTVRWPEIIAGIIVLALLIIMISMISYGHCQYVFGLLLLPLQIFGLLSPILALALAIYAYRNWRYVYDFLRLPILITIVALLVIGVITWTIFLA